MANVGGSPTADSIVREEGRVEGGKNVNMGRASGVVSWEDGLEVRDAVSIGQRQSASMGSILDKNNISWPKCRIENNKRTRLDSSVLSPFPPATTPE